MGTFKNTPDPTPQQPHISCTRLIRKKESERQVAVMRIGLKRKACKTGISLAKQEFKPISFQQPGVNVDIKTVHLKAAILSQSYFIQLPENTAIFKSYNKTYQLSK